MYGDNTSPRALSQTEVDSAMDRRSFILTMGLAGSGLLLGMPDLAEANSRPTLQRQVASLVKRMRSQGKIRSDEETSWSVYDFTGRKKLVSINEEIPRQAASMIKPFVAQAFFYTAEEQGSRLRYTSVVRDTMERMIRKSSNSATNEIMQIVSRYNGNGGPRAVEAVLKRNAPNVYRQTYIVEYIPSNGRTYRNKASARDYSRFLYALWNGRSPYSRELLDLMALPNHDRITRGVNKIPSTVRVYDKTGSTARLCGNMGIIECRDRRGRPRPYTFVGVIQKRNRASAYGTWITNRSNRMREVSNLVYSYMRDQHRLA
ncbi:MAG TPA: serine hydrolase [Chromatiaceae bacterium]|jgi:beta-lactamase class A|nr:MAG: serine hydrolase [Thiohalocapsa sp. PB-PSB1]HBG95010.1 serine hydrolase [Chromatiaceae bacterium]HCS92548.1 serine hydrolase [Chromatiaceae bacterium]